MDSHITRIVVVGGTAVGWTAAARLASAFRATVSIAVLETPDLPGAGENSQAAVIEPEFQRELFDRLGVPEEEWMRTCRASFKAAVRYVNWRTEGPAEILPRTLENGSPDYFYDPCSGIPECEDSLLVDHWRRRRANGESTENFDYACFREPPLMDARKSPRWLDGRRAFPYGWHVDIRLFTEYLRNTATGRFGVRTLRGTPRTAERDERGMLTALHTAEGHRVPGDLFLDCTGPEGLVLAGILREPYLDAPDRPRCDRAVTVTVPYDRTAYDVDPFTTAAALPSGWTWKMPLVDGFEAGHAYPGDRIGPDEAARTLCALWGLRPEHTPVRHTAPRTGHSRRAWVKNCVALGPAADARDSLAGGPLSGVLKALDRLVRDFPALQDRDGPAARFNRAVTTGSARAREFAQLLHHTSPRADTPYWTARRTAPLSPELADCLAAHSAALTPERHELRYAGVLAALAPGGRTFRASLAHRQDAREVADAHFVRIKRQQHILLETLPTAGQYLSRLHVRPTAQHTDRTARTARY
ncbi:FAD-dependent oxidoreductase [Streptomyces sp. NPDC006415]|uniref:FAD-dependent oxidoreductase n=1 Tax=Streptomyces sp. NPDC006415 TaxID=3155351 RepID=UPI0033ACA002